ncbi:hypothetical protein CROQUDRAFT_411200 [Cronartium quercuum f. sp. fusiforme G11]|uniref:NIF system FeS cluster assembly NifU C-terminal domain-containing protein n=1 Tax=Cronartium quercuum f. sp. fusiforme G11 TaxID=708437 RepID=A0A9P6TE37_9BASI|nr:hypothetical protein CROQUDRAFT_411200 [Cronartium quercuum f. sp. fusiforme G11]
MWKGSCCDCDSSTMTLKSSIKRMLRNKCRAKKKRWQMTNVRCRIFLQISFISICQIQVG